MATELTLVTKTYDLTLWLLTQIKKLPRSYRFVLGDRTACLSAKRREVPARLNFAARDAHGRLIACPIQIGPSAYERCATRSGTGLVVHDMLSALNTEGAEFLLVGAYALADHPMRIADAQLNGLEEAA